MIYTLAITKDNQTKENLQLEELNDETIKWFWVDYNGATEEEAETLESYFRFHHLAIEKIKQRIHRPMIDFYDEHLLSIMHHLNPETLKAEEVDCFIGENFFVSFHEYELPFLKDIKEEIGATKRIEQLIPADIYHRLLDKIVDGYFPVVYEMEEKIIGLSDKPKDMKGVELIEKLSEIKTQLIGLRRSMHPMRDMVYRIINSDKFKKLDKHLSYFNHINDHLLKLADILKSNDELVDEIRDHHIVINSYRTSIFMNKLTVFSMIFLPLSFLVGLYGMNFVNIPELRGKYNYFILLAVMAILVIGMFGYFKKKEYLKE